MNQCLTELPCCSGHSVFAETILTWFVWIKEHVRGKKERAASALCLKRIDATQSLYRSSSLNSVCNPLPPNLSDAGIGETTCDKFCNFSKLTIRQAWPLPLHNWLTTDQVCEGKKVCRVWTELLSWHNNFCHHLWVQLHECLWGETVQKCYPRLYN